MMKLWLRFVSWFNRKAKNFSIRLVKWTGKSKEYTHPKHLIHDETHYWFVPYLESQDMMLDLGCGDGSHTIVAANSVARISAVDHNTRNVEIAQRRAREKGKSNVKLESAISKNLCRSRAKSIPRCLRSIFWNTCTIVTNF